LSPALSDSGTQRKGFSQKKDIDYKETFSSISMKDSFQIIIALVTYLDLELHQINIKITFLNDKLDETVYMVQPPQFEMGDQKSMVFQLNKFIYGLK
jgi:Reverse transcriptase (RNA-dependent DNA polymerase)